VALIAFLHRPSFRHRAQSRAAVRVHRGANEFAERRRFGHDQRRDCGGIVGIVLSPSAALPGYDNSDIARLVLLAMTAAGTAVITAYCGRNGWMPLPGAQASRHRNAAVGGARPGRYRQSCCWIPTPAPKFINRAFSRHLRAARREGRQQAALHALMYHGRDTGAYELPEDNSPPSSPRDRDDASGIRRRSTSTSPTAMLRFSCTALPTGRMLSYTP